MLWLRAILLLTCLASLWSGPPEQPRASEHGAAFVLVVGQTAEGVVFIFEVVSIQSFDAETGLVYLRNRYYEPDLGCFTQVDPVLAGNNHYAYADYDPVNMWDPSGLWSFYESDKGYYAIAGEEGNKGTLWELSRILFGRGELWPEIKFKGNPRAIVKGTVVDISHIMEPLTNLRNRMSNSKFRFERGMLLVNRLIPQDNEALKKKWHAWTLEKLNDANTCLYLSLALAADTYAISSRTLLNIGPTSVGVMNLAATIEGGPNPDVAFLWERVSKGATRAKKEVNTLKYTGKALIVVGASIEAIQAYQNMKNGEYGQAVSDTAGVVATVGGLLGGPIGVTMTIGMLGKSAIKIYGERLLEMERIKANSERQTFWKNIVAKEWEWYVTNINDLKMINVVFERIRDNNEGNVPDVLKK